MSNYRRCAAWPSGGQVASYGDRTWLADVAEPRVTVVGQFVIALWCGVLVMGRMPTEPHHAAREHWRQGQRRRRARERSVQQGP